jgi:uroporphyrinogen-III decarboxylase
MAMATDNSGSLLVRALRGDVVERPPVWLMRQAGRYMADFRKYSEKYPFRQRSETPEIAIELSLQPWRSFGVDGVVSLGSNPLHTALILIILCLYRSCFPISLLRFPRWE